MGKKEHFYVDLMALNNGVTGSCNLVIVNFPNRYEPKLRFIVDCGLFQERGNEELNESFPFTPEKIEFCLITHNHVDHIGRLPLLAKGGFEGPIYATEQTSRLMHLALWDCNKVMKDTSKRKHKRPDYCSEDVIKALNLIKPCEYGKRIQVHENVSVTFLRNGHLIGSALIYVKISCPGYDDINLLFTGDYKKDNIFFNVDKIPKRIIEDPIIIIQESTYGDMDTEEIQPCFKENVTQCVSNGGTVVAPVFSLGRSQEILYEVKKMQKSGAISEEVPIYFDGKLAIQYTNLYIRGLLDIREDMKDFFPENLTFVSKDMRASILEDEGCKIILSSSGMGTYGPAQVYISRFVRQRGALIHFTGYTAEGTLGARLKDTPQGEPVEVAGIVTKKFARVEYTTEYSAHAKADEMLEFLKQFKQIKLVLVNHGEEDVKKLFAERIVDEVDPKDVGILDRNYFFRINPYGLIKTMSTKFI